MPATLRRSHGIINSYKANDHPRVHAVDPVSHSRNSATRRSVSACTLVAISARMLSDKCPDVSGCPAGCRQVPGCCPASALALPPRPRSTRRSAKGSRTTLSRGAQGDRRRLPVVPAKTTAAYSVISKVTTFLNPSIETACSSHCTHQFVRLHTFEVPYSRMRGKDAGSSRSTSKSICSSCPSKTKNCRVFHPMRKK